MGGAGSRRPAREAQRRRFACGPGLASGLAAALAVTASAGAARPADMYPDGPPAAHTGGFGEPSCHACHFDGPLNPMVGRLTLSGVPDRYRPERTYALEVRIDHPVLAAGGFQLSARHPADRTPDAGVQAGRLEPVGGAVTVIEVDSTGISYVQHTAPGTGKGGNGVAWTVRWTAPRGGDVVFHVAANAVNGDASEFGDVVYTGAWRSAPAGR